MENTLDRDAEAALLGSLLSDPAGLEQIEPALHAEDFSRRAHRFIYAAICEAAGPGRQSGLLEIAGILERDGRLSACGGLDGLREMVAGAATIPVDRCAAMVRDRALNRRLAEIGQSIARGASEAGDPKVKLDRAQGLINAIADRSAGGCVRSAADLIPSVLDRVEKLSRHNGGCTGLPSGLNALDSLTNGFHGGQMVVIAGRPSMGKTALAMQMAMHCAVDCGKPALVFSLEMSASDLLLRAAANLAELDLHDLMGGKLDDASASRLVDATGRLAAAPLYFDDAPSPSVLDIRARARRLRRDRGLGMIVFDYLQLLDPGTERGETRAAELAVLSRQFKRLAMELDVPVLVLSQLSRRVELRDDNRPVVSDLRDSGAIEQDADLVLLLYRDEVYRRDTNRAGLAELIIGKQRNGPTGTVYLKFKGESCRFIPTAPPMDTMIKSGSGRRQPAAFVD